MSSTDITEIPLYLPEEVETRWRPSLPMHTEFVAEGVRYRAATPRESPHAVVATPYGDLELRRLKRKER